MAYRKLKEIFLRHTDNDVYYLLQANYLKFLVFFYFNFFQLIFIVTKNDKTDTAAIAALTHNMYDLQVEKYGSNMATNLAL